jgi:hypothetical protein
MVIGTPPPFCWPIVMACEEKREPTSDIDTGLVDSLKALDPEWPIREADLIADMIAGPLSAIDRHSPSYSIKSSARASNAGGTVIPSALAVLMLITNSNLVGCSTGRSAGFAPCKILSTWATDNRKLSTISGP